MKLFSDFTSWISRAFSDAGTPSSSRLMTAVSMLVVLIGWLHVAIHTHTMPDPLGTGAAAALGTAPLTLHSVVNGWGKDRSGDKDEKPQP